MRRTAPLTFGCLLLYLTGCASPPAENVRPTVDTLSNGRVVVTNGPPVERAGTSVLDETLRLGGDEAGPESFGSILAVAVAPDGRIHVLDGLAQEVRIFDRQGRFLHAVGKPGRGPGEFLGAEGLILGPGGVVTVVDPRNARFSQFDGAGQFIADYPRTVQGSVYPWPGRRLRDGRFVDWGVAFPAENETVVAGSRIELWPYLLDARFNVTDTLAPLALERDMAADGRLPMPFYANRIMAEVSPSGTMWFAENREYRLFRRALEGDTSIVSSMPGTAPPIGEAERADVERATRARPDLRRVYLDALPSRKPVIRHVFGDDRGRVFVVAELEGEAHLSLDIFSSSGIHARRIDLPSGYAGDGPLPIVIESELYLVVRDEVDIESLVRYTIVSTN